LLYENPVSWEDTLPPPQPQKNRRKQTPQKEIRVRIGDGLYGSSVLRVVEGFFEVGSNKKDPMAGKHQGPLNVRL